MTDKSNITKPPEPTFTSTSDKESCTVTKNDLADIEACDNQNPNTGVFHIGFDKFSVATADSIKLNEFLSRLDKSVNPTLPEFSRFVKSASEFMAKSSPPEVFIIFHADNVGDFGDLGPKPEGEISGINREQFTYIDPAYAEFKQGLIEDLKIKTISSQNTSPSGETLDLDALTKELVAKVIDGQYNAIRYAYESELAKNSKLCGNVVVSFTIGADGRVSRASVEETTLNYAPVEWKVMKVFFDMTFPSPMGGGVVEVTFPIRYRLLE